ncbi:response regulator [Algibacter sp. 2305UL17-15]|uniref:response regulator n=1 Tax=Algibacter sp. 2305UL17-15 TaxID=3231268 RepID=UPI003458E7FB
MEQTIKVLIVEDHPIIIDVYKRALQQIGKDNKAYTFEIHSTNSCDAAMLKIKNATQTKGFDLIFLDIRLSEPNTSTIKCGEDLGAKIRSDYKSKIIVSTFYNDAYKVSSIFKSVNPDGFLVKNDLTHPILVEAINTVILDPPFYSKTITKILRKQSANDRVIDHIDRDLLHELSNGTKMNELPKILPLSMASLERRKRILKDLFDVTGKGDRDLLRIAREKGFI